MDEIWERALEAALGGQTDRLAARTLVLDGNVKCVQGRLPPPILLERFQNLHHLSIANIGVSSLEQFPRLRNLQTLILSDNRITVGLDFLVEAGLDSLRDLDLSNNRIQFVEDLAPLAELKLVSLDLYECPVTRVKDYRSRVFALIKTLKYLDKTDAEGNERPVSDDEEDDEEDDDEEDDEEGDEEDPGSAEVDGDGRTETETPWMSNGHCERQQDVVVDLDEDEGSDAEDDESEQAAVAGAGVNGQSYRPNGFRLEAAVNGEEIGEEDSESGEEIDEEEVGEDNDVVEVHEIEDSDNEEEDGIDDEEDDEEEEVDNDDRGVGVPGSRSRLMNVGEIDGHEQGDDDEDGDGEIGEDDQGFEEDDGDYEEEDDDGDDDVEEEDEESGEGYIVQPMSQVEDHDAVGSDIEPINDPDEEEEEEEVEDDLPVPDQSIPSSSSSHQKRKRDEYDDDDDDEDDDDEDDDDGDDGVDDDEEG